jgi:hypothetical protein
VRIAVVGAGPMGGYFGDVHDSSTTPLASFAAHQTPMRAPGLSWVLVETSSDRFDGRASEAILRRLFPDRGLAGCGKM